MASNLHAGVPRRQSRSPVGSTVGENLRVHVGNSHRVGGGYVHTPRVANVREPAYRVNDGQDVKTSVLQIE